MEKPIQGELSSQETFDDNTVNTDKNNNKEKEINLPLKNVEIGKNVKTQKKENGEKSKK